MTSMNRTVCSLQSTTGLQYIIFWGVGSSCGALGLLVVVSCWAGNRKTTLCVVLEQQTGITMYGML